MKLKHAKCPEWVLFTDREEPYLFLEAILKNQQHLILIICLTVYKIINMLAFFHSDFDFVLCFSLYQLFSLKQAFFAYVNHA